MLPCSRFQDDLALMATGDLAEGGEAARAHAATCAACASLAREVGAVASLASIAGATLQAECEADAGDLADTVLARLATSPRRARRMSTSRTAWLGAAAAAGLAAIGVSLVVATRPSGGLEQRRASAPTSSSSVPSAATLDAAVDEPLMPTMPPAAAASIASVVPDTAPVPAPPARRSVARTAPDSHPMFVRHVAGRSVELAWTPDGREKTAAPHRPYRVLASASPDFADAEPIEVHGHHLVASASLPALRSPGRALTFFRVE